MTEQELRALVREAIARHVGGAAGSSGFRPQAEPGGFRLQAEPSGFRPQAEPGGFRLQAEPSGFRLQAEPSGFRLQAEPSGFRLQAEDQRLPQGTRVAPSGRLLTDPAHAMFRLEPPGGDTACIIEPSVTCNHCGYCKSFGH